MEAGSLWSKNPGPTTTKSCPEGNWWGIALTYYMKKKNMSILTI
jgi:hypothetical protein